MEHEVTRLIEQYKELDKRISRTEAQMEYQQKDLQRILEAQASNRVQVETVIKRLDSMEQNILRQLSQHLARHGGNGSDDLNKTRMYLDVIWKVVAATVVLIIGYLFAG